eukprot:2044641-Rhodomonas_salina.2
MIGGQADWWMLTRRETRELNKRRGPECEHSRTQRAALKGWVKDCTPLTHRASYYSLLDCKTLSATHAIWYNFYKRCQSKQFPNSLQNCMFGPHSSGTGLRTKWIPSTDLYLMRVVLSPVIGTLHIPEDGRTPNCTANAVPENYQLPG